MGVGVADVHPHAAAVGVEVLAVKHLQVERTKHGIDKGDGKVPDVLVIDLVVGSFFDDVNKVRILEHKHSLAADQAADRLQVRFESFDVAGDVRAVHQRHVALAQDFLNGLLIHKRGNHAVAAF